jgi:hypothetical protein
LPAGVSSSVATYRGGTSRRPASDGSSRAFPIYTNS